MTKNKQMLLWLVFFMYACDQHTYSEEPKKIEKNISYGGDIYDKIMNNIIHFSKERTSILLYGEINELFLPGVGFFFGGKVFGGRIGDRPFPAMIYVEKTNSGFRVSLHDLYGKALKSSVVNNLQDAKITAVNMYYNFCVHDSDGYAVYCHLPETALKPIITVNNSTINLHDRSSKELLYSQEIGNFKHVNYFNSGEWTYVFNSDLETYFIFKERDHSTIFYEKMDIFKHFSSCETDSGKKLILFSSDSRNHHKLTLIDGTQKTESLFYSESITHLRLDPSCRYIVAIDNNKFTYYNFNHLSSLAETITNENMLFFGTLEFFDNYQITNILIIHDPKQPIPSSAIIQYLDTNGKLYLGFIVLHWISSSPIEPPDYSWYQWCQDCYLTSTDRYHFKAFNGGWKSYELYRSYPYEGNFFVWEYSYSMKLDQNKIVFF